MEDYFNCPQCNNSIVILSERWDGWTLCPVCNAKLSVDFDYDLECDSEYHIISIIDEDRKNKDFFISKIE